MTVKRGKVHDYFGMKLDFSSLGKFIVNMEDYLDGILSEVPKDMAGNSTTPAADHLFKVRDSAPELNPEKADLFHRVTTQILFVAYRGQPNLRTVTSFLTKRVKLRDEDD